MNICFDKEKSLKKRSDFKSAFYISLVVFSIMAIIAGFIIVELVRF